MKKALVFIGLVLVALACGSTKQEITTQNRAPGQPVDYKILLKDSYGGTDAPENRIITTQKELENAYAVINRMRRPGISVPEVDFTKKAVVAVFMGQQSSGGNSVEIEKVEETDKNITVHIKKSHPGKDDMTTMAITQPFVFVELPATDKEVIFK